MILLTISCPEAYITKANNLARCIGYSEADGETFTSASYQDIDGNLYAVASGLVQPAFVTDAMSPLIEPAWGADMIQANEAQAIIEIWTEESEVQTVSPNKIVAIIGYEVQKSLSMLKLIIKE